MKDGEPIILIECKHWQQDLSLHDNQLLRYFNVSKAKFGILTNGIIYRFYTDLVEPNIMDTKPFLEINLLDFKEAQIEDIKKFHKSYFNVTDILSSASELKYMGELKAAISNELSSSTPEFVRYFGKQVYDGVFTAKILDQFTVLVKRTINAYINDMISDRLKAAIKEEVAPTVNQEETPNADNVEEVSKIVTTDEELQAFYIIKSILRNALPIERVTYRDAQSYFAVFVDNNNRKTICRLYLNNSSRKRLVFLDENKKEISYDIQNIDDIYQYSDELMEAAIKFL